MPAPHTRMTLPNAVRVCANRRDAVSGERGGTVHLRDNADVLRMLFHGTDLDPTEVIDYLIEAVGEHHIHIAAGREPVEVLTGQLIYALMCGYTVGRGGYGVDRDRIVDALRTFTRDWGQTGGAVHATGQMTPATLRMDRLVHELHTRIEQEFTTLEDTDAPEG